MTRMRAAEIWGIDQDSRSWWPGRSPDSWHGQIV